MARILALQGLSSNVLDPELPPANSGYSLCCGKSCLSYNCH